MDKNKKKLTPEEIKELRRKRRINKRNAGYYEKSFERFKKEIEEEGFHTKNVSFRSGYFIFEFGDKSVVVFEIEEIPNWTFGIWWDYDEEKKCVRGDLFTQPTLFIDKFKPSRSFYCEKLIYYLDNLDSERCLTEYLVYKMLKFLKEHPYKAYGWEDCTKYEERPNGLSCYLKYKKDVRWKNKNERFENWANYNLAKWLYEKVLAVYFEEGYVIKRDWISPSYELMLPYVKNSRLFGSKGCYSLFLDEKDIEILNKEKETLPDKLKSFLEDSDKLKNKYEKKIKRYNRIAKLIGVYYFYPEVDDVVLVTSVSARREIEKKDELVFG